MVKLTENQSTIVMTLAEKKQNIGKLANEQIDLVDQAVGSIIEEIKLDNDLEGEYRIEAVEGELMCVPVPEPEPEPEPVKRKPVKSRAKKVPEAG